MNFADMLRSSLDKYEIGIEKLHIFLRDAASNITAATNRIAVQSADCLAHKIHLVKNLQNLQKYLKNGVSLKF